MTVHNGNLTGNGSVTLRVSRPTLALITAILNAANVFFVPLVSNFAVSGFFAATLNAVIVYLATESKGDAKPATTPA